MTCKDCYHFNSCNFIMQRYTDFRGLNPNGADCSNFKDKSKFIELPCKVGDTVYRLNSCTVPDDEYRMSFHRELYIEKTKFDMDLYCEFGKRTFLTREESEKALNELKRNGKYT